MKNFYIRWISSTYFGVLYQKKYSAEWDAALNRLIDSHWQTVAVGRHTANLGGVEVWISNAFYCYGHQYGADFSYRPSIRTMRRLDSLIGYVQLEMERQMKAAYEQALEEMGR